MKKDAEIRFFLHMGYFPDFIPQGLGNLSAVDNLENNIEELANEAAKLWRESVAAQFVAGRRHVVPLSGGLDSRAILAALMECTEASNIETYTYGTPGTYDYDLGCGVAQYAGTRHSSIALNEYQWQEQDFYDAAQAFGYQTVLFHHPPLKFLEQYKNLVIWSGYLGDVYTGAHCPDFPVSDLRAAKINYLDRRQISHSINLSGLGNEDLAGFIGSYSLKNISFEENILFHEIQKFTAPHLLIGDFDYRTPFVNSAFSTFSLGLPFLLRNNQKLYKYMLMREWPGLFKIPTKSYYGLPLESSAIRVGVQRLRNRLWNIGRQSIRILDWPSLPMTNYMDLDLQLRRDRNLQSIVFAQLRELSERQVLPWINIDKIWNEHMSRKANHGDAIKTLFSLGINLKGLEQEAHLHKAMAG